ncbi:MAG: hypothetical protein ACM359_15125 [Bacillota bacterium]
MKPFQMVLFVFGVAAFLASLGFMGSNMGDTLWRAGVALMLGDVVCIQLWPAEKRS